MHFLNFGCSVRYRIYDSIEELSQGSEEHQTARAGGGGPIPAQLGHADAAQPAPHSTSSKPPGSRSRKGSRLVISAWKGQIGIPEEMSHAFAEVDRWQGKGWSFLI